jgi:pyruvate dehydrogenase (quinone)/pyruvate oxidase
MTTTVADMLVETLRARGPVVVQAVVDPFEPPWPPKTTLAQTKHLAETLVRGEPNRQKIALTALADKVREII